MTINELYSKAIDACLQHNIPFVLYALPSDDELCFHAALPDKNGESHAFNEEDNSDTFFINFYGNDEPYTAGVPFQFDAQGILNHIESNKNIIFDDALIRPSKNSTYGISYNMAFNTVKQRLKKTGGKVVLSQHQTIVSTRNFQEVIYELFCSNPSSFRYVCFTPETGVWLGATPELLLKSGKIDDEYITMSLAGTKPITDNTPWDEKNLEEQQYVTEFIRNDLKQMNLDVEVEDISELPYGNIKHLCNVINVKGKIDVIDVLNELSPTPAVSGIPRDIAMAEIDAFETHCRRCYSGYVGIRENNKYQVYVNIRCAFLAKVMVDGKDAFIYNLYSGGGILATSDCSSEWQEAQSKISKLKQIIEANDSAIDVSHKNDSVTFLSNKYDLPF